MTHSPAWFGPLPPGSARIRVDAAAAIAVSDPSGRIILWTNAAQLLWGYAPEEVIGKSLTSLFTTDGAALLHRDGRSVEAQVCVSPLGASERPGGFLLTAQPRVSAEARSSAQDPGDEALMRWVFEQHPSHLGIFDCEARSLKQNRTMARATGLREDELRDRRISDLIPDAPLIENDRWIRQVASTGDPAQREAFLKVPGEPKAHAWTVDYFPLKDSVGRVRAVAMTAYDYSEQYESRERLSLLGEARTRIGASLELEGTAEELAELLVPRFADVVSVDLFEAVFGGELPAAVLSGPVLLRRAAQRPEFFAAGARPAPGETRWHPASSPVSRCVATGRAELHDFTDPKVTRWFADEPTTAAELHACGAHSLITVPIRARGTTLGAAAFLRHGTSRESFAADDLTVAEDLVARAAICLDNARRFTRERGIALLLQSTLLPRGPITHPGAETAARYLPADRAAEAGGDWFDVIPLPGTRVGLVVGDVVGHGIGASVTMGRLRTAVRTLADIDLQPDELLTHLDDMVTHPVEETGDEADGGVAGYDAIPGDIGASCLYAVYDPVSGTCALARAGHPPPVLVRPDGTTQVLDVPAGPPLGLGSLPFEATEVNIPEGSLLALFTDGLVETRGHDIDERIDELRRALARPVPSLEELCDTVLESLHSDTRTDDIALLVARTRVLGKEHVAEWDVPADAAAVAETRKLVDERLTAWGLEEAAFTMELVVSELVTNAIRYGTEPIRLRLIKERSLICEVSDSSNTAPHLRRAQVSDEGGRGLFLVAELTQRWGTRYTSAGKTIWAERALGRSPRTAPSF
ncbi:SpoIIE family protein phosphatase [Streptomyces sp. NBC_01003]|uniref:SpoIIE family protein phosphatase n=1 Tax=Streptomyces sp. NBC_01003 TaxID=2903714 RepID=UPI00386927D0|nr:SpoIIE family protein phosphatase [Streptomyces sp. NBC_01003]